MLHLGLDLSRKRLDVCVLGEAGAKLAVTQTPPDLDGEGCLIIEQAYNFPVGLRLIVQKTASVFAPRSGYRPARRSTFSGERQAGLSHDDQPRTSRSGEWGSSAEGPDRESADR